MNKLIIAILVMFPLPVSAHLEIDLLTPDGALYPGCDVESEVRPTSCPFRLNLEGWDVYISSAIMQDEFYINPPDGQSNQDYTGYPSPVDTLIGELQRMSIDLLLLKRQSQIPPHFTRKLQNEGVTFYIPSWVRDKETNGFVKHPRDLYNICNQTGGCYGYSHQGFPQVSIVIDHSFFVISHELAHAWHDLVIPDGFNNQCIIDTYNFSVTRDNLYDNVLVQDYWNPHNPSPYFENSARAYASVNHKEYFAELVAFYTLGKMHGSRRGSEYQFTQQGIRRVPYRDRLEMYEVDRNGYLMVYRLFAEFPHVDCDTRNWEFPDGWWPK